MWGMAGAMYTPGMPELDAFDAAARDADRIARQNRKARGKAGPKWYPGNKGAHKRRDQDA